MLWHTLKRGPRSWFLKQDPELRTVRQDPPDPGPSGKTPGPGEMMPTLYQKYLI